MENNFAVDVKNLTKKFGKFLAVDNIELKIKKGEIYGFLGPNGAGKTTIIRMLCGILLPTNGEGKVIGFDIMKEPEEIKKSIGYVSQKFSLYDDLTVEENLKFYSKIYGVNSRERIEKILEDLDLKDKKNFPTKNLPAGFKQRLSLACAITHKPSILFLDEPTSSTDPVFRRNFWEIIYKIAKEKTTILLTTHYLDEAEFCERVCLIYKGEKIAEGKTTELKEKYKKNSLEEIFIYLVEKNL